MHQHAKRLAALMLTVVMLFSLMGTTAAAESADATDTAASTDADTTDSEGSTGALASTETTEPSEISETSEASDTSEPIISDETETTEGATATDESSPVEGIPTTEEDTTKNESPTTKDDFITAEDDVLLTGVWSDQTPIFSDEVEDVPTKPMRKAQARNVVIPTYKQAYDILIALKKDYPEGMTWTNYEPYGSQGNLGPYYQFRGGKIYGGSLGVGCAAFAFLASDAVFGDLPAYTYAHGEFTFKDIKVGDILRVNNDSHFVIVLQKGTGGVVVAEANYNKSVHWGRTMTVADVEASTFIVTRYAENYKDPDETDTATVIVSGTEGTLKWELTSGGMLTVSGTGAIPNYSFNDQKMAPWDAHNADISAITIEEGITGIGDYAFYQSNALSVYIPNTVAYIGQSAFYGAKLVAVTIPGTVKTVGDDAFRLCANLTSATISDGVEIIGQRAFHSCTSLKYMDFPASITDLGAGAFTSCSDMKQVRFAPGTKSVTIGDNLFSQCWYLSSVTLPANADRISNGMFQSCTSLTTIAIPKGVSSIMDTNAFPIAGPFMSCPYLATIDFEGTEDEWKAKDGPTAITNTNTGGASITVNFNVPFNNPFAVDPTDPGDRITEPGSSTPATHDHDWAKSWSSDATHHWHECDADDCPITANSQKDDYDEHSYGDWITETAATASQDGSKYRDCTVCGERQTESIPATGDSNHNSDGDNTGSGSDNSGDNNNNDSNSENSGNSGSSGNNNDNSSSGNSGSGSHSSGSSGGSTSTTMPDNSTTTTVTDPQTGIKTTTTKQPDGSSTIVTTQTDGTTTTVSASASGETATEVQLSTSAISAAKQQSQPIALPIAAVEAVRDIAKASPITVRSAMSETVTVAIPVSSPSAGTVAIAINADGSTDVIKTSVPTNGNIVVSLTDNTTIKIVDNSKDFTDVAAGAWAEDAIAFTSARGLFTGTTATTFSPESPMTRAMLVTVLARFDGADTTGGSTWYARGVEWATARGISDGANPNSDINREQLVTMLWRYMGSPTAEDVLIEYSDVSEVSSYAQTAMQWAVKNSIITGSGNGRLDPQSQVTRAQVAQILKNLITNMAINPA